ncbi:MAG: hypothetical protein VYE22_12365 [Myxococcota bacterium]|nr:hypothetical protein [Myxococcota bacterium]
MRPSPTAPTPATAPAPLRPPPLRAAFALYVCGAALVLGSLTACRPEVTAPVRAPGAPKPPPERLEDTGLARAALLSFSPQYPLWTDGADKRRWIALPPGTSIDASDPDDWRFPPGTRLWKEFSFGGRPVETRYMEARSDGSWSYATYVHGEDGVARRAPDRGVPEGVPVAGGAGRHVIPGQADCVSCHEGRPSPVLGFSLLQLSGDRDPNAPHAAFGPEDVSVAALVRTGRLRRLPPTLVAPRVEASSPTERAALGYLHGNCGGCHNDVGPLAPLGMVLAQSFGRPRPVQGTLLARESRFRLWDRPDAVHRVHAGEPERSVLLHRLRSRDPNTQMPPVGSLVADEEAAALLERWIRDLPGGRLVGLHN